MAKILIYSDLHIGATRVSLDKIKQTLEWINMVAKEQQVSHILNLGDTFDFYNHTKSKMRISPKLISELNDYGHLFYGHTILRGNHEFHEEGDLLEVLALFGADVITEPKVWTTHENPGTENDCWTEMLLLPYDEKPTDKKYNVKYVFTHCDIKGAKFESGFEDDTDDSIILKNVKYEYAFDGHYHIKQQIRNNIYGVGAVQSRVKSNNVERMGVTILDTYTNERTFIENPYAEYEVSNTERTYNYSFKEDSSLMEELDNFKLEKTGIDAFVSYLESKRGTYDNDLISFVIEYLKGGMQ